MENGKIHLDETSPEIIELHEKIRAAFLAGRHKVVVDLFKELELKLGFKEGEHEGFIICGFPGY